jgi:hypothetical protein
MVFLQYNWGHTFWLWNRPITRCRADFMRLSATLISCDYPPHWFHAIIRHTDFMRLSATLASSVLAEAEAEQLRLEEEKAAVDARKLEATAGAARAAEEVLLPMGL